MNVKMIKIAVILSLFWNFQTALAENLPSVQLSEIMPNPKGEDKNNEWIELYNPTQQDINLKNWQIVESDPTDNSKKTKKISLPDTLTIKSKSYLVLQDKTLKITLRNKNVKIELKDPSNNVIDAVSYKKAKEDSSLSKIRIKNKTAWAWTNPTKNKQNPTYRKKPSQKTQPQQVKQSKPPTENWLKYSVIPISILLYVLYRAFRFHRVKNNLRNISSG